MEQEEEGNASTPFWLQSRRNNTYFHRTTSLGSRTTTIFFAGATAILIIFFIIPPFVSSISQIFRPHLVRKSWDYLNFVLVLFAVLCGFLSRNTNHNKEEEESSNKLVIDRSVTPRYWIDQTRSISRLRSVSSYPDLSLREYEGDERWRFYDDTRVSRCRYDDLNPIYPNQDYKNWQEEFKPPENVDDGGDGGGRKIRSSDFNADKVEKTEAKVVKELTPPYIPSAPPYNPSAPPYIPSPPYSPPSPPRAPPPDKQKRRKTKRVYQDLAPKEERDEFVAAASPVTSIPLPANKQEKKKGGATRDFLITLRRKKKKKQRQQSIDGLDLLFGSDPPSTPPPPPPPPPPPFFQTLFSYKKGKSKRTSSSPHEQRFESIQFVSTGNESPLLPIPPPPPPPPFKMPAWKFVKRGDYVRMASDISISSDEPDDSDSKSSNSMFCPSPDVDTKADDFIARFRAGLKLEKINSVRRGRSNLGPEPGPDDSGL